MTERLYYDDAYKTEFGAVTTEYITYSGRPAIALDTSFFYPSSGGQPHDIGTINGINVVDVIVREADAAILHILENPPAPFLIGQPITATIDWGRRFDHMQQHTGQHILTQAFIQTTGAKTVSFHLSSDSVTIDLETNSLTDQQIQMAEYLANTVIQADKKVTAYLAQADEQDDIRMRKLPKHMVTDGLRVVEIEGFDKTACGGTHVNRTGEIGLIKIIKTEKRGDKLRLEFRCGKRALNDYEQKHRVISSMAAEMNCRFYEIPELLSKLRDDLKMAQTTLKELQEQLISYEAEGLLSNATHEKGYKLICASFDGRDVGELRLLASRLTIGEKRVALLGTAGEKSHLIFARSADLTFDMGALLKIAMAQLNGRGGGQPTFAQGGGISVTIDQIKAAINSIAAEL